MQRRGARYLFLAFLLTVHPAWIAGCAHTPPPVSEEMRSSFGTVAVISCGEAPAGEFYSPTSGKGAGAAKGSVLGIGACLGAGAQGANVIGLVVGLLLSPACALGGAAYGAVEAEPSGQVEASVSSINKMLARTYIGDVLKNRVVEEAVEKTDYEVVFADFECPAGPDVMPDYRPLSDSDVNTVLEIEVEEFSLEGRGAQINPEINLVMNARARLINTKNGSILYERLFEYAGKKRTYSTWAHNEAAKLRLEIERACERIAWEIVREVFIAKTPLSKPEGPIIKPSYFSD